MDTNSLTVLPGGQKEEEDLRDVEFTEEGMNNFIAQALKAKGEKAKGITVDDVLKKPICAKMRAMLAEGYKKWLKETNVAKAKKRRELQVAKDERMAEQAEELCAMFREEMGLPAPLTQEEIQAKLKAPLVDSVAETSKTSAPLSRREEEVRSRILALREEHGDKLPGQAFESSGGAILFRRALKLCIRPYHQKLTDASLDAEYRAELVKRRQEIQNYFPMADAVVLAWGEKLEAQVNNDLLFKQIKDTMSKDERFAGMIARMGSCPTPEQIKAETMTEAQLAEAKAKVYAEKVAAEVALKKRREEARPELKARLREVAKELSDESAEQRAKHLARKYGHMANIKAMFTEAACDRKALAQKQKDEQAAKVTIELYLKAAGLTAEEFEAEYAKFAYHQERIASDTEDVGNQKAGSVSPLGNRTRGDRTAREKARRARQEARNKADEDARPKPNAGSGDIAAQSMGKNGNKK